MAALAAFVSAPPARASASGDAFSDPAAGIAFALALAVAVLVVAEATLRTEPAVGADPVDVQDAVAIAKIVTKQIAVLARKAATEADGLFNDSPVSSFPALAMVQSNPL